MVVLHQHYQDVATRITSPANSNGFFPKLPDLISQYLLMQILNYLSIKL